jgi:tetratricopeptide (TPR) repeat protein
MFRGSEIRLPSLFNRNTSGPATTWDPRQAAQQQANVSEPVGSLPGRDAASVIRNHYVPYTPPARHSASAMRQTGTAPKRSSPAAGPRIISPAMPSLPLPAQHQPAAHETTPSRPAGSSAPQSAADELILQAHELSASAKAEEHFTAIIDTCKHALQNQPSAQSTKYANELTAWALNRRGQLKAEDGRTTEAIRDFDDAIAANAECWRAVHNRGVLLAQACEFEKAFDDFNRTVKLNPQFAKAYSNRGALFVVAGDLAGALRDYEQAIELDPKLAVAHRGAARVCHLFGRLDNALAHYNSAVRLAPGDAYAIASRGDLLTDLGRYAEANADYERSIKLDPSSMHAYSGSAWLLATCPDQRIRDPKLAMARAQKSIELSDSPEAINLDTLAAAQASGGDFAAAAESIRKAIQLAAEGEREVYQDRLAMYQHGEAYVISPVRPVAQVSYQE